MSQDELSAIFKAKSNSDQMILQRSWEQTREICFWTVISTLGNKDFKKPDDLFKFSWEKKIIDKKKRLCRIDPKELERMRKMLLKGT